MNHLAENHNVSPDYSQHPQQNSSEHINHLYRHRRAESTTNNPTGESFPAYHPRRRKLVWRVGAKLCQFELVPLNRMVAASKEWRARSDPAILKGAQFRLRVTCLCPGEQQVCRSRQNLPCHGSSGTCRFRAGSSLCKACPSVRPDGRSHDRNGIRRSPCNASTCGRFLSPVCPSFGRQLYFWQPGQKNELRFP